jgi:hypothetical protein
LDLGLLLLWVLIGLLFFYIVSVKMGSSLLFAAGNIVVEALLIVYAIKNKTTLDIPEKNPNEQPGQ